MHRVFLIDSNPLLRLGLVTLIDLQTDMKVCGEAESGREALRVILNSKPDLVVADIALPGVSGLEFIRELQVICPELPVLIYSDHDEMLYAERVIRAGGRGYVLKSMAPGTVIDAIRQTAGGGIYLSRSMTDHMLRSIAGNGNRSVNSELMVLSDRELEVFELIGRGKGTQDIADQLCISIHTVETHRARIREKLKLSNAADIIRHAVMWVESDVTPTSERTPAPLPDPAD
jgi:DNA-binding NarL/FixJ family response regulator